jgi:hypothetical protein
MKNIGWFFSGNREKPIIDEEITDRDELAKEIMEENLLDIIEDEIDRRGGIGGLDGGTISDILSYYIANDSKLQLKLQRELRRRGRI